ncbi:MAG: hypothetical protein IH897_07970, partial [Planctomycetes bacterium]|nr:hypothetical protein [Planctomycetota bacterium]
MTAVPVLCRYPLTTAWMVVTLAFGTCAFGQEIRFFPIRTAPLDSPAGTVGDPVTPQFNVDLGCWELQLSAGGVEVDLDLQAMGWGDADCVQSTGLCREDPGDDCTLPSDCRDCVEDADCLAGTCTGNGATCLEADNTGSGDPCISDADCSQGTETCHGRVAPCTLGAIQATVIPALYDNGVGGTLVPKGWPGRPSDGVYQATTICGAGGNGDPCVTPFDITCFMNGFCIKNPDWVMPRCTSDFPAISVPTLTYAWATAAQNDCNLDDGSVKTFGGLILEVPVDADGTYMINFDPDPNNSFMTAGNGRPIPGVVFTPACITITFACQSDADCDDGFPCTTDTCDEGKSTCENIISQNSCLIDDICYANGQQDPAGDCRFCSANLLQTDWSNRFAGVACGDTTDTDCDNPNTCDGAGACLDNFETIGSACGDPTETECDNADTCDGAGS